ETCAATQVSGQLLAASGRAGKRTIRQVIAKGLWSNNLEGPSADELCRCREPHNYNAKTVAEQFGIDRRGCIPLQDTDEIRHRTEHGLPTAGNKIFVLEVNGKGLTTVVIEPLDGHLPTRKTTRHTPQHVHNFALKYDTSPLRGHQGR